MGVEARVPEQRGRPGLAPEKGQAVRGNGRAGARKLVPHLLRLSAGPRPELDGMMVAKMRRKRRKRKSAEDDVSERDKREGGRSTPRGEQHGHKKATREKELCPGKYWAGPAKPGGKRGKGLGLGFGGRAGRSVPPVR